MNWESEIKRDPTILNGKPTISGTRLSVEFIMGLLSVGWSIQEILENYPTLTEQKLRAAFAFAAEMLQDELIFTVPQPV